MGLPRSELEGERQAVAIAQDVDFRRKSPARPA